MCVALVKLDAMGCPKAIAENMIGQGGDYLLALEGKPKSLCVVIFIPDC